MKNEFFKNSHTHSKRLCYNSSMLKTKTKAIMGSAAVLSAIIGIQGSSFLAEQASAETANTNFRVNVVESLTVSLTTDDSGNTGSMNTFLRNEVNLGVDTNNAAGFTASMYYKDSSTTALKNGTNTLPTLSSSYTRGNFPANYWGYSFGAYTLDGASQGTNYTLNGGKIYNETAAGNNNGNYYPIINTSSSPIIVMDGATTPKASGTQEVYFGAKGDASLPAGTYAGVVVFNVVTGVINNSTNPVTPTNPATPSTDTNTGDQYATYTGNTGTGASRGVGNSGYTGTTVYTTTSGDTTTTQISGGDVTHTYPLGVTENTTTNIARGTTIATGLAALASVAATSGVFFFILAIPNKDDDDDDEEEEQLA